MADAEEAQQEEAVAAAGGMPDLSSLPDEQKLLEAANSAQAALALGGRAQQLRDLASMATDPKEREKYLTQAYEKEIEANGQSMKARMFKSGAFQGAAGGAGIGGAVGMGVGTIVGTLVGTVATLPTTVLGGLVGSGVGAFHGPFIKLGGKGGKDDGKNKVEGGKTADPGEQGGMGMPPSSKSSKPKPSQGGDGEDGTVPDPDSLREAARLISEQRAAVAGKGGAKTNQPSSGKGGAKTSQPSSGKSSTPDGKGKKKPRKIEVRSAKK